MANERAGGIDGLDEAVAALRARVETAVVVAGPEEIGAALAGIAGGTVVAAGGDGTLNMLVQHLWAHDLLHHVVLGLLPLGTGNDLARTLGIPLDAEAAAAVAMAAMRTRAVPPPAPPPDRRFPPAVSGNIERVGRSRQEVDNARSEQGREQQ